ncbi:MAG: mechanosensitive ion channel [Pirellulales bacterium]
MDSMVCDPSAPVLPVGRNGFCTIEFGACRRLRGNIPAGYPVSQTKQNPPTTLPGNQVGLPATNLPTGSSVAVDATLLNVETITARQAQLQAASDIDPAIKQTLGQLYEAILVEIRAKLENERLAKELAAASEAAPAATQDAKRRKENLPTNASRSSDRLIYRSVEELRKELQTLQSNLQAIVDQRTKVEAAMTLRETRRKDLPRLINEEKELLRKLNEEAALPAPPEADARIVELQRALNQSKREASNERTKKLESEQRTYEAEAELLPLKKELSSAEEKLLQIQIKEITDELNKRRESLIQAEKNKIEQLAQEASTRSKTTTDRLVKRVNEWLDLAKANSAIQLEIEAAKARKSLWSERFKIMKERIDPQHSQEVGSFNSLVGLMLRRQRSELPDPIKLQSQLREYEMKMVQTETLILELDDWKTQLTAMEQGDLLNRSPDGSGTSSSSLLGETEKLLAMEKELISNFRLDASNYFDNLFSLAGAKRDMVNLVRDYRDFVDQHILWMRSSDRLDRSELLQALPALEWLCHTQHWKQVGRVLYLDLTTTPWLMILGVLAFGLLVFSLPRFRRLIAQYGEAAERSNNISFLPTIKTIALTLLASSPIPFLLIWISWRLDTSVEQEQFPPAVSFACLAAARYFVSLELIRQICRRGGLAEKHFQWSSRVTQILRSNLRWLIDLGVPLIALVSIVSKSGDEKWESSLGRIAFCSLMVVSGIFLIRVLRPANGIFTGHIEANRGGWTDRLRYVWYTGIVSGPWLLFFLSLWGYHYTAQRLAMHFHTSIISLAGLTLLHNLLRRWFMLNRRAIIIAQARQRLIEAQKRDPVTASSSQSSTSEINLAEINAQTMRLVTSVIVLGAILSIAFIWSGVLPAVGALNSVTLWEVMGSNQRMIPITLANVLLAIPIMAMTIVAARNLPGLLEIALLQHLPLENAVRYAISTLSRYAIFVLGIAMTFNSVGVRWSSIQWLVAALGVGLGFGLQEIFANFISGLILLFEQPIRVGDVITLGDTTGSVSRIRMRATTITNFDRQELIIPNKDLITGRLLNWTLSDSTNRLKFSIGVAYGTDTDAACRILSEICQKHPNILKDPSPTAFFENFGDNALILTIRVFLENLDHRMQTRHELHSEFHRALSQAGIEIPFPQRDLHLRSLPPSLEKWLESKS